VLDLEFAAWDLNFVSLTTDYWFFFVYKNQPAEPVLADSAGGLLGFN